jgi:hypothetical protein
MGMDCIQLGKEWFSNVLMNVGATKLGSCLTDPKQSYAELSRKTLNHEQRHYSERNVTRNQHNNINPTKNKV